MAITANPADYINRLNDLADSLELAYERAQAVRVAADQQLARLGNNAANPAVPAAKDAADQALENEQAAYEAYRMADRAARNGAAAVLAAGNATLTALTSVLDGAEADIQKILAGQAAFTAMAQKMRDWLKKISDVLNLP